MTPAPNEPVHFLLVDDLEENLLALEALLRRDGLVPLQARSGPEALELLLKYDVALALVDVQMPGMDGFELAELMRGMERTRRVPIIFLTAGGADWQRRFRGYEAGAVDFLHKPIESDVLRSKAEVFFELFRQRQEVARQRDELRAATEENARLLRESRQYAAALQDADRRKDEFLATLAHELRNPLAPVRTGLQIMKLAPQDAAAAEKVRDMMERQLSHMVRLVDDLLDVSRISRGKLELRKERVELRTVVEGALEASRPLIEAARHRLVVRLPEAPVLLDADPTRLAQIVSNLLNNAAKYTPDGGRIDLSAVREGAEVVVRVSDNGVGIPEEMLPRVFEVFTQVGRSIDRAQGGLGIGLSIVKRLVELHGGAISADSFGPGAGSTFVVRLPVAPGTPAAVAPPPAPEPPPALEPPPAPPAADAGLRVLVVDDNVDGAESLAMLLRHSGHAAWVAHDGGAALDAARACAPEVVFLDIGLPGMSGYEVAARLRGDPRSSRAVLVALTGWGSEDDRRRAAEAGFDRHLTKPVEAALVEEVLAEAGRAPRLPP